MKILHVITGLRAGGAETMLAKLLGRFARSGPDSEVVALAEEGPLAAPIRDLGVPVSCLDLGPGIGALKGVGVLAGKIRASRPDVVQTWMYHANLLGTIASRLAGPWPVRRIPLVWNLRQSNLDPVRSKPETIRIARLGARLSRLPDRVVCVSHSAHRVHAAMGYDAGRMCVIPNGFDLARFRPDPAARARLQAELAELGNRPEIAARTPILGMAARFDPQKDHHSFLRACARLEADGARFAVVLAGDGMVGSNEELAGMIDAAGLREKVHLLGRRGDMPSLTAAFDVAVSSSAFGEGFSNAIGEALACGVPVVATDVGDSAAIVGDAGRIVPPEDVVKLAGALAEMLELGPAGRRQLGAGGRARMERDFTLDAIADRYRALYRNVLDRDGPVPAPRSEERR